MKTDEEIFSEGAQLWDKILSDEADKKTVNKFFKETTALNKKKNAALKNFKKWGAIAKKRNELYLFTINGTPQKYAVPVASKSFYVTGNSEPTEVFTNEGKDYLVIFNDEAF